MTTTPAEIDAAATAIVDWMENLLSEALVRFGSVEKAQEALVALMAR